jgi:hypothetical protein
MSKKLTNIDFIYNAKNIHGDKYNYSLVKYINALDRLLRSFKFMVQK